MSPTDVELLARHLPVLRLSKGERFLPLAVEPYVEACSLHMPDGDDDSPPVVDVGELTVERLGESWPVGTFLRFVDPGERRLQVPSHLRELPRGLADGHRLTRVGLVGRFIDVVMRLINVVRATVPWRTADAAAAKAAPIQAEHGQCCYGRVVRSGGWIVLHYGFFYAMNDWRTRFRGVNDHEADWEQVLIYLDAGDHAPQWVAYASHDHSGDDLRRHWDDAELQRCGDRPIVYVGAGSHASYFAPGEYTTHVHVAAIGPILAVQRWFRRILKLSSDANGIDVPYIDTAFGDGVELGPAGSSDLELRALDERYPWVGTYRGLWGLDTLDPAEGERAPAGPKFERDGTVRAAWVDPVGWAGLHKVIPPSQRVDVGTLVTNEVERIDAELTDRMRQARLLGRGDSGAHAHTIRMVERQIVDLHRERAVLADLEPAPTPSSDLRAHLSAPAVPNPAVTGVRHRLLSFWATVSAPAMLAVLGLAAIGPWGDRLRIAVSGMLVVLGIELLTKRRLVRAMLVYVCLIVLAGLAWATLRYLNPAVNEVLATLCFVGATVALVSNVAERVRT